MEKKKNVQLIVIAVLAFAVLFMSVGFASYAQTLNINGTVNVAAAKWSVHYVTNSYQESENSVAASAHNLTDTDATFTVTLPEPGTFYEFTANVINDGTFDANLTAITLSSLTTAQDAYLNYTVYYNGTAYTSSASGLTIPLSHTSPNNTVPVKVRVEYVQPPQSTDLPATNQEITLTASFDFAQAA